MGPGLGNWKMGMQGAWNWLKCDTMSSGIGHSCPVLS